MTKYRHQTDLENLEVGAQRFLERNGHSDRDEQDSRNRSDFLVLDAPRALGYRPAGYSARMASPAQAPLRPSPLQSQDWIRAASVRFSQDGVEAVRIELLARDLGVSKGSFYWHFRDREDLLNSLIAEWEREEIAWLDEAASFQRSPAARWANFVERGADPQRGRFEAALRSWARRDQRISSRVASIEKERAVYIAGVLSEVGFTPQAAETWAELALLVYLGWVDRATRDPGFRLAGPGLGEFLSQLVLAASVRPPAPNR